MTAVAKAKAETEAVLQRKQTQMMGLVKQGRLIRRLLQRKQQKQKQVSKKILQRK